MLPRRASACATRSNSSARLGSPVSESWNARWLSSWRLWRSPLAIALKESATWLSSLNESSSTRWARSPLPSRRAELLSAASGRRIEATSRRATSSVMIEREREGDHDPDQLRALIRADPRRCLARIVATTSSGEQFGRGVEAAEAGAGARTSARGVPRRATSGSTDGELALTASESSHPVQRGQVGARAGERCPHARRDRPPPSARAGARVLGDLDRGLEMRGGRDAAWRRAGGARVLLSSRCWALMPAAATISGGAGPARARAAARPTASEDGRNEGAHVPSSPWGRSLSVPEVQPAAAQARRSGAGVDRLRVVRGVPAVGPDLEVQVRARRVAGQPALANTWPA